MTLALIGVNHKTAPIELRERIAISREVLPGVTRALAAFVARPAVERGLNIPKRP